MGQDPLKLIQEVDIRWNSNLHMFQRQFNLREPVGAALASLQTDITAEGYHNIHDSIGLLQTFSDATVKLLEEKMNNFHSTNENNWTAYTWSSSIYGNTNSHSILAHMRKAMFKILGFFSHLKVAEVVKYLTHWCTGPHIKQCPLTCTNCPWDI